MYLKPHLIAFFVAVISQTILALPVEGLPQLDGELTNTTTLSNTTNLGLFPFEAKILTGLAYARWKVKNYSSYQIMYIIAECARFGPGVPTCFSADDITLARITFTNKERTETAYVRGHFHDTLPVWHAYPGRPGDLTPLPMEWKWKNKGKITLAGAFEKLRERRFLFQWSRIDIGIPTVDPQTEQRGGTEVYYQFFEYYSGYGNRHEWYGVGSESGTVCHRYDGNMDDGSIERQAPAQNVSSISAGTASTIGALPSYVGVS